MVARWSGFTRRGPLLDSQRRRQALDVLDLGLAELLEEVAGVDAERFDVLALALGVDGVERQAALTRAGEAGQDDQAFAWQLDGDVLQVVLGSANDADVFGFGGHCTSQAVLPDPRRPVGPAPAAAERTTHCTGGCYEFRADEVPPVSSIFR